MSRSGRPSLLIGAFALVVVASALALIFTKHESRELFIELERLSQERDALNIEYGQLQIEQSTLATHSRIETLASERLSLVRPTADDTYVIEE